MIMNMEITELFFFKCKVFISFQLKEFMGISPFFQSRALFLAKDKKDFFSLLNATDRQNVMDSHPKIEKAAIRFHASRQFIL